MVENCPDSDQGSLCEFLVVEKILLYETNNKGWKKGKKKRRIAAITNNGLFELYKDSDKSNNSPEMKNEKKNAANTIEGLRSYKSIVLKQFNVEIARRREKTGYDISLIDSRKPSRRLQFHVLYQIEKWLKAFHEHAASCPPKLPPYVALRKEMKKDEEIVSATLEVLLPIWETRFVTLVGDNLTVYKGKDASSDVLMSSNLNEMIVQPTKDAYFQISEKYESDTKAYNHILGLKTTKTKNPAAWLKQLATFYEKGTPSTLRRTLGQSSLPTMSSPNPSPLSMRREISDPTGKNIPQSPSTPIRAGSLQRLHRSGTHTTITTNDSFMHSIDEDATLERTRNEDGDSSTGYISPSDIAARPQLTLASPAATITLQTLLEEFSEEAEGRKTPEKIDEIEDEIDNGLRLDETQLVVEDKVAAWMDQHQQVMTPSQMEDDDLLKAYLNNPLDYDSDRSSGGSDENVESEWLKESFSAANSFNLNSSNVFRERPVPRPKQPQIQNVYSRLFDQFDGDHFEHRTFQETFSRDYDFGTQFSNSKTKTTTHVYEQFVPSVREENWKKTLRVETKEESECIEVRPRFSRK